MTAARRALHGISQPAPLRSVKPDSAFVRRSDPTAMTPEARLAELGAILATGFRRLRISREKQLASSHDPLAHATEVEPRP